MSFQSFVKDTLWLDVNGARNLRRQLTLNYVILALVMGAWAGVAFATFHLPSDATMTRTNFIALHLGIDVVFGAISFVLIKSIRSIYASRRARAIQPPPLLDYQKSFIWAGVLAAVGGCFALATITALVHNEPAAIFCFVGAGGCALFALVSLLRAVGEWEDLRRELDESDTNVVPLHPNSDVA